MAMTNNRLPAEDNDTTPLLTIQRPLYFTILFLSLTILIDTTYTIIFSGQSSKSSGVVGGPLQNLAEFIIPQLVVRFSGPLLFATEETGIDGKICPPDGFLDRGLLTTYTNQNEKNGQQQQTNGIIYSNDFDPRNKKSKPSSFPHCELKKWVQIASNTDTNGTPNNKGSRQCPEGEEYVTYIYPTQQQQQQQQERKNTNVNNNNNNDDEVKIIHLATPTNCIPTSTIASLQSFTQHYSNNSNPQIIIAIYIHSQEAMDAFLYQRAWNVFPEVKEGLLCGMAKVRFVVKKVLDGILLKSTIVAADASTNEREEQQHQHEQRKDRIANDIATLTKRDIWRYLILWEFGGTVIDLEVLQSLITSTSTTTTAAADTTSPLINVSRQWFASRLFGNDNTDSNINNNDGDAIITMIESEGRRIPVTGIISATPNHPLLYFSAKWALRSMIWDNYLAWGESPEFRAFNDMGRNTDTAALTAGLNYVLGKDWGNQSKLIGNANKCDVDNTKSVHFLNGNDILPKSLASPMQDMIPVVKRHVDDKSELPEDDTVIIKSFRGMEADFEKKRKEDEKLSSKNDAIFFSCMEYRLRAYTSNVPVV